MVRLYGWSFREQTNRHNPLETFDFHPEDGVASLGVLHCDLDMPGSSYAPVSKRDLTEGKALDGWFLGHIHKPSYAGLAGERPIGYLGSLTGLDAGEPGSHGPWLVEVEGPGTVRARQIPLAPVRYEREVVSIENVSGASLDDIHDSVNFQILAALDRVHDRLQEDEMLPRVVACRLHLDGKSKYHRLIRQVVDDPSRWPALPHTPHCFVEKIEDGGEPAIDIQRISGQSGLAAMLASKILALEDDGEEAEKLIRDASIHLGKTLADARWNDLVDTMKDREEVRRVLLHGAIRALEELVAQKGDTSGGGST